MQSALLPGQRLATRDGAVWRWDGYTRAAGAETAASFRLRQRARLDELRPLRMEAESACAAAGERHAAARRAAAEAAAAEGRARAEQRAAEQALARARQILADAQSKRARIDARQAALAEALAAIEADHREAETRADALAAELAALPDGQAEQRTLDELRADLARLQIHADGAAGPGRRPGPRRERACASAAGDRGGDRVMDRQTRRDAAPDRGRRRTPARDRRGDGSGSSRCRPCWPSDAGGCSNARAPPMPSAARRPTVCSRPKRDSRTPTGRCAWPSRRWRTPARIGFAPKPSASRREQATRDVARTIADRLGGGPDELAELVGVVADDFDVADQERRLDRLRRERELMGPVNLRAEEEASDLEAQIAELDRQRVDLLEAIAKLRRGVAELDREGRERLRASFGEIDRHFQALFRRLFGGGRAHLALTDSDDPLEAGLEIMASPPGKRLQSMSLLSGGEQTLTAVALRFAMFLTRPAPICVLDEVDAALDDANVDRFCSLLTEIAGGGTRFLVITHHRLTMARMDRLFGVTMQEKGASRLVSVDLMRAEVLRQTG